MRSIIAILLVTSVTAFIAPPANPFATSALSAIDGRRGFLVGVAAAIVATPTIAPASDTSDLTLMAGLSNVPGEAWRGKRFKGQTFTPGKGWRSELSSPISEETLMAGLSNVPGEAWRGKRYKGQTFTPGKGWRS